MARIVNYSEADLKKLKVWNWKTTTGVSAMRARKMVRPSCAICQGASGGMIGWWNECDHDPYWSSQIKKVVKQEWKEDADGDLILDEAATAANAKTKKIRVPNIVEVHWSRDSNAGQGPQLFAERKGYKDPEAIGLAPYCMTLGCQNTWPRVETAEGRFCSEFHAKMVAVEQRSILNITTGVIQHGMPVGRSVPTQQQQIDEITI
jgi:hypothetical protein